MLRATTFGMLAITLAAGQVQAGLIYDNGPINGLNDAWTINFGYVVSNSFTFGSATTLTDAQIGLWVFQGDVPTGVDWAIGTTMLASDIASGTAALTSTLLFTSGGGYDIYESDFSLSAMLVPGTYWLSLSNATSSGGNPVFWDNNDGPSVAWHNDLGDLTDLFSPGSNSSPFQLFGDPASTVPEPGSLTLVGLGAFGLSTAAIRRRRKQNTAA